jgi:hypothetical protein
MPNEIGQFCIIIAQIPLVHNHKMLVHKWVPSWHLLGAFGAYPETTGLSREDIQKPQDKPDLISKI